jgi:acyl transferase domain-containing protein
MQEWPSELFVWKGSSRHEIVERVEALEKQLQSLSQEAQLSLRDLAFSVYEESKRAKSEEQEAPSSKPHVHSSLAIVATSLYELRQKLLWVREALTKDTEVNDPRGIYFSEQPLAGTQDNGKVAFLFPGQGSQYVNMLMDLTIQFPEVRAHFERANRVLSEEQEGPMPNSLSSMLLSRYVFPQPWFTEEEKLAREEALRETNIAQPAIGAASMAMFHLLGTLGVRPDFVAGHSYGEYVALCAAGVFDEDVLIALSEARGRFIVESAGKNPGTMAAINAGVPTVSQVTAQIDDVCIANKNSPEQTVIAGTEEGVKRAVERFQAQGIRATVVRVACAFHSPIVAPACKRLAEFLSGVELSSPKIEVFSNTTAGRYPKEPKAIAELLAKHLARPVEFVREILAMYEAGARIFVEVGPRSILTTLADEILSDKPHLTVASDQPTRNSLTQLQHLLGQLAAHAIPVKLDRLYRGRKVKLVDLNKLQEVSKPTFSSTTWLVNGHRAKPISEANKPEPLFPQVNLIVAGESEKSRQRQDAEAQQAHLLSQKQTNAVQNESRKLEASPSASQRGQKQDNHSHPGSMAPEIGHSNAREDGAAQVMMQYQQLMNRFLDTQKSVMLTYLQSRGVTVSQNADGAAKAIASRLSSTVSHQSPDRQPSEPARPTSLPTTPPVAPPEEIQQESKGAEFRESGLPMQNDDERQTPAPGSTEIDSAKPGVEIPTKEELTERLLQIVSERTGYPKEMLDLDLDTEADLGIDSIKRIEILSSLLESYVCFEQHDDLQSNDRIEELAQLRTLRAIIDWLESRTEEAINATGVQPVKEEDFSATATPSADMRALEEAPETEPLSQQSGLPKPSETAGDGVNRYILEAEEKPLEEESKIAFVTNRVLVLTDDGNGIAQGLAESLKAVGHTIALVKMGERTQQISESSYTADLAKTGSVAELLKIIREQQGPIGGFVHLLPLKPGKPVNEMDLTTWRESLKLEVKSLFHFSKELGEELTEAASSGDACFMAATAMGGTFASATSNNSAFFPGHGGVAGLLKSIAHEWSDLRIKVIDFSRNGPTSTRIHQLMQEITSDDGLVEVGYSNGRRYILTPKLASLDKTEPIVFDIDSSWVILITGGARGVTADVALQVAQSYQPTLLLVGRSALPVSEESPETAGLATLQELKAAIMEKMRKAGQKVTPAQVEAAYSRLLKDREMRENIAKMRSTGAKVHYYQVDVRDEQQFGGLIDEIYQTHGRLDGVIHGAGTIEDKLIRDKTPESFDRVFDTKVDSAFILSQKLRAEKLSFFVFFSSVAGRFGNRGQSDYAAANEVYNKLAIHLNKRYPGRVVSAIWGPWARAGGMVSAELEKQFAQRGIELLPRTVGPKKLDEELRYGRKGDVEVILAGRRRDTWKAEGTEQERKQESREVREYDAIPPTPQAEVTTARFPLISTRDSLSREVDDTIRLIRKLDVARDTYLNDHKLDGNPVLPMAMAMELMAEVAMSGWQGYELSEISDLQVLQGIVLEDGQLDLQVTAKPLAEASERADTTAETSTQIEVSIASANESQRVYYRAKGKLQKELPPPISQMSIYLEEERLFPMDVREAYRQWLFHGPTFHGITEIEGMGSNGIIAKLNSSSPQDCLVSASEQLAKSKWIIDPVVIDSGLQLIILWARENLDMTPLPTSMLRYRRFGSMSGQKIECQVHIHVGSVSNILISKFLFFGEDGHLLGLMESMKGVCSKALNRLSVERENIKMVQG